MLARFSVAHLPNPLLSAPDFTPVPRPLFISSLQPLSVPSRWGNYRHQADVCHAYQVLVRGGLRPAHIVVMMYDDIAYDPQNPFPGQVFNSPGEPLLSQGCGVGMS